MKEDINTGPTATSPRGRSQTAPALVRLGAAFLLCAGLAACGGGGSSEPGTAAPTTPGGQPSGSAPATPAAPPPAPAAPGASAEVRLVLRSPTRIEGETIEGGSVGGAFEFGLNGDYSALANTKLYVVVEDPDKFFSPDARITFNAATGTGQLALSPLPLRSIRRYEGNLRFFVCFDARCDQQMGGTPLVVPYSFNVAQGLKLTPASPVAVVIPADRTDVSIPLTLTVPARVQQRVLVNASSDVTWTAPGFSHSTGSIDIPASESRQTVTLQVVFNRFRTYSNARLEIQTQVLTTGTGLGVAASASDFATFSVNAPAPATGTNLTPLAPLPGAAAWTGFQGSAAHEGYVPATVDPQKFNTRFTWAPYDTERLGANISPAVVADGRVCVSINGYTTEVVCLSEATGQPVWRQSLATSSPSYVGTPVVSGGVLHVSTHEYGPRGTTGTLQSFDLATGAALPKVESATAFNGAAVADAGSVFLPRGTGFVRIDVPGGQAVQCACEFPTSSPELSPASLVGDMMLALWDGQLYTLDRRTMGVARTIAIPGYQSRAAQARPPAAGTVVSQGATTAFAVQPHPDGLNPYLVRFDMLGGKVAWSLRDGFSGPPVVAGNTLYVRTGAQLQVRSAIDGSWIFGSPLSGSSALVVIGSHALVSSAFGTDAIDPMTGRQLWHDVNHGSLAVSPNGILYISGFDKLTAINLR